MQNSDRSLRIFLCHSSADKPAVRELYQRLRADGFEPWLDEEDLIPGQDWRREIPKAVKNSDVVIVCLSSGSVNKAGYVQKEIKFALDTADEQPEDTIFIIPLKLEECKVPDRLSRWQWVNYFTNNGYSKLLRALNARTGSLQPSTAPLNAMESLLEPHPTWQPQPGVVNQSGGVSVESDQVSIGQDIVGRDKVVQEGDAVSGDKVVQYIEHYHAPPNTQDTAINVPKNAKIPDLSDRALWITLSVVVLIGLLLGIPLANNLFSGRAVIPVAALTNTPAPTKIFTSALTTTPPPTRITIPTSTRAPLPVITGTASTALGEYFVTIREIKSPGNLVNEQVILTNLSGQVNMAD
jgi:hypothetical protein